MRILITGAGGQVGRELVEAFADHDVVATDHQSLDVTDRAAVASTIANARPDAIVHAAAWTAVDDCEGDRERAFAANAFATHNVAEAATAAGAHLCYLSTDYVFDGTQDRPYVESDEPCPASVYGQSKLAGEAEALAVPGATVARLSWVCGRYGANMVKTILRLAADHPMLRFVDDQRGHPTFAADGARMVRRLVTEQLAGLYHVTNQGAVSWYEFAQAVLEAAGDDPARVEPISTADLDPPRPAPRPANSVLENAASRAAGIPLLPDFRAPLHELVTELPRIVTTAAPLVRVVIVNYNGGDLTLQCLRSVLATDWPGDRLEVVLVDNASTDGIADRVVHELADVRVIRSPKNVGFAGGCNLGMADLGPVDYVALVNNDATVDAGWLAPLVEALDGDPALGAAIPKILFSGSWVDVELGCPTHRPGRGDRRELGVRIEGARVDGDDVWPRVQRVRGFWGDDPRAEWTSGSALLRVPAPDRPDATAELRLASDREVAVVLRSGPEEEHVTVGRDAAWHPVRLRAPRLQVVNNTGTELLDEGYGADRGYLEPDDGTRDQADDVFAWCGAAVVLRRAYLDDVGHFDERLFLYYEDLELAWRGHERGWRTRYVPASTVHHVHAASTGEGSALKEHFTSRNRLLVTTRHAEGRSAVRTVARFVGVTASYAVRDVVSPLLHGHRPRPTHAARRVGAFGAYLVRVPGALRSRRADRLRSRAAGRGRTGAIL